MGSARRVSMSVTMRLMAFAALGVLLASCATSTPAAMSPATSDGTRTIVDMAGRYVRIPTDVTRVATNIPQLTETVYLLGGIDKLVVQAPLPPGSLLPTIDDKVRDIRTFPVNSINKSALRNLRPQVFVMSSLTPDLLPALDQLDIPVVEVTALSTPEILESEVNMIADLLGGDAPGRAGQFHDYYEDQLSMVKSKAATLPASASRSTVYYAPGPTPTTTAGAGNITTTSIQAAAARNVAAVHGIGSTQGPSFALPSVSSADLLAWNPDAIIAMTPEVQQEFLTDDRYDDLTAVRDHRVYVCPVGVAEWCAQSVESALQPLWIAWTLHPNLFSDMHLTTTIKQFYSTFYNYPLDDTELADILDGTG